MWRNLAAEKPAEYGEYLIHFDDEDSDGVCCMAVAVWESDVAAFVFDTGHFVKADVIHWKPLPEPPKAH
jgi:hypothetical protein